MRYSKWILFSLFLIFSINLFSANIKVVEDISHLKVEDWDRLLPKSKIILAETIIRDELKIPSPYDCQMNLLLKYMEVSTGIEDYKHLNILQFSNLMIFGLYRDKFLECAEIEKKRKLEEEKLEEKKLKKEEPEETSEDS